MIRVLVMLAALLTGALTGLIPTATPAQEAGRSVPLAVNLAPVNDWSTQQPFVDVMKTARRWIGHKPGQWGGVSYQELEARGLLDDNGWPIRVPGDLASIGTLILTDLPADASVYAGRYVLRFEGEGVVEVAGSVGNLRYGEGRVAFDFQPGGMVIVKIQRSDPRGTGDYVRNISVVRQDQLAAFERGALFNPLWLSRLQGFEMLRFMDWMLTNGSTQRRWQDRPRPGDFSYSRRGVPVEVMIALANRLGADAWFAMPHLADADYNRRFAAMVARGLRLPLKAYVEYSNEVWNGQFEQAAWAEAQARARWGKAHRGHEFYGMKAAETARIWSEVFAGQRDRLVTVIATQTGWPGLERDMLEAPLWQAETGASAAPHGPPHAQVDAYAVAGYFGHALGTDRRRDLLHIWLDKSRVQAELEAEARGLSGADFEAYVAENRYDAATRLAVEELYDGRHSGDRSGTLRDLLDRLLPYHAEVARRYGLKLIMYEGGSHVVSHGAQLDDEEINRFFVHLNYTAEMAGLYERLLAGWAALGDGPFALYCDVQKPGKWGSWGHLRHLGDDNPRWRVIERIKAGRGS